MRKTLAAVILAASALALTGCNASGLSLQKFTVGECVNFEQELTAVESEVGDLPIVSCDGAHDGEVYLIHELEDGDLPATLADDVAPLCTEAFEGYVGVPYAESSLDFTAIDPSADTWKAGDREVICIVVPVDGELSASVKGSGL